MHKRTVAWSLTFATLGMVLLPATTFAHVAVEPAQVAAASEQTFTVAVPNEKDSVVTGVRLVIPDTVMAAIPTVKPGWTITTKKADGRVIEINWTAGQIPTGQRDDFSFSAQAPASGELHWKAYQTYADGSTSNWDKPPTGDTGDEDAAGNGAYSVTSIVDDLAGSTAADNNPGSANNSIIAGAYALSAAAIALAVTTLRRTRR